jgi:PPOX class probable F420-dependent enzyme
MDEDVSEFLTNNHAAVMATINPDGSPHVARVGVGIVDGKLWSSGTRTRVRTRNLARDDRAALAVLDSRNNFGWLGIQARVIVHDGFDAPEKNLALYRAVAGEPDDVDEYLEAMVNEQRLIYEFVLERTYGMS